ncbi:DUF6093 family protein [Auraticoccus monumenti]|uniref:Uncharacterized protein n=1 Tax=Auraticoccus monumenti TaxID=675864 RepID=A0A1G6UIK0_9ACTN|nr:DUF6093 family protein [Auraticoccus monumenti]SDD41091.1 hypothetical protein SAMN04489747_0893 [Auraticoccus monumenti]
MIGDSIRAALPRLRAEAESLMTSECEVQEPGRRVFNEYTKQEELQPGPTVWSGICKLRALRQSAEEVAGDQALTTQQYAVNVPITVTELRVGHWLTITEAEDAFLVGRTLVITSVTGASIGYQRRLVATDNLG